VARRATGLTLRVKQPETEHAVSEGKLQSLSLVRHAVGPILTNET
jgi:hypothetical protein